VTSCNSAGDVHSDAEDNKDANTYIHQSSRVLFMFRAATMSFSRVIMAEPAIKLLLLLLGRGGP
jgi:hypothetical protein